MNPKGRIVVKRGDITDETTDAIVNAANTELVLGAGVAGAIRRRGGPEIQTDCDRIGPIPLGEAAVTGAGRLKTRYVIHAAGMALGVPLTTETSLTDAVRNSLRRADEHKLTSIAFPAIGTGVAGFPVQDCARIMLREIAAHLTGATSLERVHLVLFDEETCEVFRKEHEKL